MPSGGRKSYGAQLVIRVPKELAVKLKEEADLFEMSISDLARMALSAMFLEQPKKSELIKRLGQTVREVKSGLKRK